ncbi:YoaK family protein [Pedobacter sp. SL55]|uniref:YoaK family protein n=1 Tax=Pedobacter sp. SL55 TaxID=2995161 RepID=UPI00226FFB45|nr:YoaK family protein [Pedobacter sp. SL55]WAC39404.1 YoaK family protein [Pedobacter sp. SL55]
MLRYFGDRRTASHNLRLAILLCLTAGFVNAAGFLGFSALTTNVTGHAALLAEHIALRDWRDAGVITILMLLFLAGAFCSSLIIGKMGNNQRFSYVIPILMEIIVLLVCSMKGFDGHFLYPDKVFAGSLLFAMGLQNALVSVISG